MAIEQEFWLKYIMDRLFMDNAFMDKAYNEDDYVINGSVVHIPQPGAKPQTAKNRSTFPAAALRRTDTDILYALDEYTSDPTHIQDAEKVEVSYDKIASVLDDHAGTLTEMIADDMIIKWLDGIAAGNMIPTTGAATAVHVAGQTGTRKAVKAKDFANCKVLMNKQLKGQKSDRYCLMDEDMMQELIDDLTVNQLAMLNEYADMKNGVIGRFEGFDIYTRNTVAMATSGGVINPYGAAVAATNNVACLFWHKNAVTKAVGEKKFFEDKDNPLYYGDIYSSLIRMGGRRRRSNDAGVVALVQAA